ncbi:DUF6037 family protein [Streptococcus lactarius]|uniref:DUF6037 family protein n=1 Tax=Streptococcus lactarius TaxID=684066 RepID=UPI0036173901
MADFINHFSSQIPTQYIITDTARQTIVNYDRIDSTSDGIYPVGVKNWDVIHAQNPNLPKDKYHRTKGNLLKTKELYPKIYELIKDKDITIIYSQHQGAETAHIKSGIFRKSYNENTARWKTIKNLIETNPAWLKNLS